MQAKSDFNVPHQDLLSTDPYFISEAQSSLRTNGKELGDRSTLYLGYAPKVAIYTLAAITTGGLPVSAWANSDVSIAEQPEILELENTESMETLAVQEVAIASPESVTVQEFAPETLAASEGLVVEAKPEVRSTMSEAKDVAQATSVSKLAIAPPEQEPPNWVMPTLASAEPGGETLQVLGEEVRRGNLDESIQEPRPQPLKPSSLPTLETPETERTAREFLAASQEKSYKVALNTTASATCLAQVPAKNSSCLEVERLQDELRALEDLEVEGQFRASPALSIVIPTAFGADNNTGFISATYQERTRYSNVDDGALGIGIGLGDAEKAVGVELSYAIASFGSNRDFGSGGFNVKVHRRLPSDWAVAAGWNGFLNVGDDNDFEHSLYGAVSKIFRTREDITQPFSRVAVTAGVGNGQFRTEDAVDNDNGTINVFGNIAVRVAEPVSLIAEWSGQDLGVGVSIAPFKNIPLVITPAVRDIAGAGDGPRFVLGTGFAFKF
ncbi:MULTISPECIES: hypothetical protein [unclassified Coleofasciculus]|uniref:hypothetical protein n=1 Tax=unclassified Coleofasciculus TaxID=2692782 RepID=UPI00188114F1|nr:MULTISPECIES: hypothetical protein [unclassified Coleofasciculus]MBE9127563.1 hypothetical protein [Coleofasciculus sp. LEGE 07081]MBE9147193.1 hypothetical protein [Coleofasciculus sp. LEGE 07092]